MELTPRSSKNILFVLTSFFASISSLVTIMKNSQYPSEYFLTGYTFNKYFFLMMAISHINYQSLLNHKWNDLPPESPDHANPPSTESNTFCGIDKSLLHTVLLCFASRLTAYAIEKEKYPEAIMGVFSFYLLTKSQQSQNYHIAQRATNHPHAVVANSFWYNYVLQGLLFSATNFAAAIPYGKTSAQHNAPLIALALLPVLAWANIRVKHESDKNQIQCAIYNSRRANPV